MSKTNIFLIIFIVLLLGGAIGGGGYFLYAKNQKQKGTGDKAPGISDILPFKKEATADREYIDEAGFSFSYPKDVTVDDVTPEEGSAYSVLKLKTGGKEITLQALETKYKTVEDWLVKDKTAPQGANLIGATTLGGVAAKQYSIGDNLLTVAIDQSVIYLIEGPRDNGYLEDVQNLLISTFAFADMEKTTASGTTDVVYEEEEVIE